METAKPRSSLEAIVKYGAGGLTAAYSVARVYRYLYPAYNPLTSVVGAFLGGVGGYVVGKLVVGTAYSLGRKLTAEFRKSYDAARRRMP